MEFKIINPTDESEPIKGRKLICKIIGCDSKYILSKCTRCDKFYCTYHKSVIGIIKNAIYQIKQVINE